MKNKVIMSFDSINSYRALPEVSGARTYVAGDIHGCAAELDIMLNHLVSKEKLTAQDRVIFVGDYIDRGPDSARVVDLLIAFGQDYQAIFLKGNHEDMLLDYLGMPGQMGEAWLINGGQATLRSYGLSLVADRDEVLVKMPQEHLKFYEFLERYVIAKDFVVVHAGLDPLRELEYQLDSDLYWIREEFIEPPHHFDKLIVFGHTPQPKVLFQPPYKIGVDTGLVFGNRFSVVELSEKKVLALPKGKTKVGSKSVADKF